MNVSNFDNWFEGWFSFAETCAQASWWAVEMGLCSEPVSVVGIALWLGASVLGAFIFSGGGRDNFVGVLVVIGCALLFAAVSKRMIPPFVLQAVGAVILAVVAWFAARKAWTWTRANRSQAVIIGTIYLGVLALTFYGFQGNVAEYGGEIVGLPIFFTFILLAIAAIVYDLAKGLYGFLRRKANRTTSE